MAQAGDPGPFDWARAAPAASARPSRTGTRMVTPMAKRLLRLLLAHPELVAALGDQQLEIVCQRSEEHTSELQSLMRISYAVFCLKKKKQHNDYDSPCT